MDNERMTRMAPDPVAALLCAIAALASVASIAAINWVAQDKRSETTQNRRKPNSVLRDLERDCAALCEVLKRLHRNLRLFSSERGSITTPIKFGVHAIQVPQGSYPIHQSIVSEIAGLFESASRNSFEVMCLIEDGVLDPPDDVFFQFAEMQERLNELLIHRIALKETVAAGCEIAMILTTLVRSLKSYRMV